MWAAIYVLAATWGLNLSIASPKMRPWYSSGVRVSFDKARDVTVQYSRRPGANPNCWNSELLGMICVGAAYTVIVRQTSGYTPAIGEGGIGCE